MTSKTALAQCVPFRREGSPVLLHKEGSPSPFSNAARQALFDHNSLGAPGGYFEITSRGRLTLERPNPVPSLTVGRRRDPVRVRHEAVPVKAPHPIPAHTSHRSRSGDDKALRFLGLVPCAGNRFIHLAADDRTARRADLPDASCLQV